MRDFRTNRLHGIGSAKKKQTWRAKKQKLRTVLDHHEVTVSKIGGGGTKNLMMVNTSTASCLN